MRVSIAFHAPAGSRFGPKAFDASIGLDTRFFGHPARLVVADVHESGGSAILTFEVEATEPIIIPSRSMPPLSIMPTGRAKGPGQ